MTLFISHLGVNTINKGKLLYEKLNVGKEFYVRFKFMPTKFKDDVEWYNILHFTTNKQTTWRDSGGPGTRIPSIYIKRPNLLSVASEISGNYNKVFTLDMCPINKWTDVRVEQVLRDAIYLFRIFINGKRLAEIENNAPAVYPEVKLYVGNPWIPPQEGYIKDLDFSAIGNNIYTIIVYSTSDSFTRSYSYGFC